jgi:hypothetical protein
MPTWLQIVLGLSAPLIACFGAYISYKQWVLGAYKLKHDLFEKRWKVFAVTHDAIVIALQSAEQQQKRNAYEEFVREKITAQFLFPKDVCDYLQEIANRVAKFNGLERDKAKGNLKDDAELEAELAWLELQPQRLAEKLSGFLNLTL